LFGTGFGEGLGLTVGAVFATGLDVGFGFPLVGETFFAGADLLTASGAATFLGGALLTGAFFLATGFLGCGLALEGLAGADLEGACRLVATAFVFGLGLACLAIKSSEK